MITALKHPTANSNHGRTDGRSAPEPPDQSTTARPVAGGESVVGILELFVIAAAVVLGFLFPHLLILPLLALVGMILIGLVVWDDHVHDAADERRRAQPRRK